MNRPGVKFRSRSMTLRFVALILLVAITAWRIWRGDGQSSTPTVERPEATQEEGVSARVKRVVDGDTLLLEGGERVRLIGVDTPETKRENTPVQPFGPEASEFTRAEVEGKTVRLRFDKERRDDYGRTLAYVYVGDRFLNEELIRAGLGRAMTRYPYSETVKRRFRSAEAEAKREKRGIWSLPAAAQSTKL